MRTDPIQLELALAVGAAEAFDAYLAMDWWDPAHTADAQTFERVVIEPRLGGSVTEQHADGSSVHWGTVSLFQPGMLLSHSMLLAHESAVPSELMVRFAPTAGGCLLHLQHGGWEEANARDRARFTDWAPLLSRLRSRLSG